MARQQKLNGCSICMLLEDFQRNQKNKFDSAILIIVFQHDRKQQSIVYLYKSILNALYIAKLGKHKHVEIEMFYIQAAMAMFTHINVYSTASMLLFGIHIMMNRCTLPLVLADLMLCLQ